MGPNQNNGGEQADENGSGDNNQKQEELSFYSDDSYEYCPFNKDIAQRSKFKNVNDIFISHLNFEGLPEYETTDEEEEEEDENMISQKNEQHNNDLYSPEPQHIKHIHGTPIQRSNNQEYMDENQEREHLQQAAKKPCTDKEYRQGMNYVKKFYQKAGENNRMPEQENEN